MNFQGGFLEEQDKAGAASHRALYYNVSNGYFSLFAVSHAVAKCQMDFSNYPFDTQICKYRMTSTTYAAYLV